jgi:hypothetical protein
MAKNCRVVKNEESWHLLTIRGDRGAGTATLVGPRTRQYLSVHAQTPGGGTAHFSISGKATLRALGKALLAAAK